MQRIFHNCQKNKSIQPKLNLTAQGQWAADNGPTKQSHFSFMKITASVSPEYTFHSTALVDVDDDASGKKRNHHPKLKPPPPICHPFSHSEVLYHNFLHTYSSRFHPGSHTNTNAHIPRSQNPTRKRVIASRFFSPEWRNHPLNRRRGKTRNSFPTPKACLLCSRSHFPIFSKTLATLSTFSPILHNLEYALGNSHYPSPFHSCDWIHRNWDTLPFPPPSRAALIVNRRETDWTISQFIRIIPRQKAANREWN